MSNDTSVPIELYTTTHTRSLKDPKTAATITVSLLDRSLGKFISCLPPLSFGFMVYSGGNAIYQTRGEFDTTFFVIGSFSLLGSLFWCMREFDRNRQTSPGKSDRLKIGIWLLSVSLTALFSYRVTTLLDSFPLSIFVWSIAVFTSFAGCYLLFICK